MSDDPELDTSNTEVIKTDDEFDTINLKGIVTTQFGTSEVRVRAEYTDLVALLKFLQSLGTEKKLMELFRSLVGQYEEEGDGEGLA